VFFACSAARDCGPVWWWSPLNRLALVISPPRRLPLPVALGCDGEAFEAVGDVVNTAARLESAAPVDVVLVDEWTFRATSRAIRYDEAAPVDAMGKKQLRSLKAVR
jgi:hypothetical protein